MTAAAVGASEHQAARTRRICEREFLRDHPAHRDSENMRARDLRMVQYRRDIGRHIAERELRIRLVALAGAAIIDYKKPEPRFHQLQKRLAPSAALGAEAHDERDRVARAANLVAKFQAVPGLGEIA